MLKFANQIDKIARTIGQAAGWLIVPLIAVIMFDVITRKIDYTRLMFSAWGVESGYSISTLLQDGQWHFHAVILMLSFGIGYLANAHVRVDIFREMLSRRKQGWLELAGLIILGLPFLFLMMKFSFDQFYLSFWQDEGSESMTGLPNRWLVKSVMVIGFVLVFLAVLATIIRLWIFLTGKPERSEEALGDLAIFSDQSTALADAQKAAEELLERERAAAAAAQQQSST